MLKSEFRTRYKTIRRHIATLYMSCIHNCIAEMMLNSIGYMLQQTWYCSGYLLLFYTIKEGGLNTQHDWTSLENYKYTAITYYPTYNLIGRLLLEHG